MRGGKRRGVGGWGRVVSYDETTRLLLIFVNGQSRQIVRKTEMRRVGFFLQFDGKKGKKGWAGAVGGGGGGGGRSVVSYEETTRLRLIFLNGQSRQIVRKTERGGFLFTHSLINRRTDHTKLLTLSHLDALRRKIAPPPSFDLPRPASLLPPIAPPPACVNPPCASRRLAAATGLIDPA